MTPGAFAPTPRPRRAPRLWAALIALAALLAPLGGAAQPAEAAPVPAWKVTWLISAGGTHTESNSGFTSFTRRSTRIAGEAIVTPQDDGTNLVTPYQLSVSDDLYTVHRDFDERNGFAINQFNIVNPARYSGRPDAAWRGSHLFTPERDDDGSYYMSAAPFDSTFAAVAGGRPFTYRVQITTHEGAKAPILSEQSYYTQVLLNQVTASKEIERIPGDPTGRFFLLDEQFTVSPESGGMGNDMEEMPVHITVAIRPADGCVGLGRPIPASSPGLAALRDSIKLTLEPDEPFIPFNSSTTVTASLTCDGIPIKGATLELGADVVPLSGHHLHHDPSRPRGWLNRVRVTPANYRNALQVVTDEAGRAEYDFSPGYDTQTERSDISGTYRLRGFAPAYGTETEAQIDAKLDGLVEFPMEGPRHTVLVQSFAHRQNNFGTPATVAALERMVERFVKLQEDMNAARTRRGAKTIPVMELLFGDISLPWGGHFDTNGYHERSRFWMPPHVDHDMGREVSFVPGAYYYRLTELGLTPAEATSASALLDLMVEINAGGFGTWVAGAPRSLRVTQGQGAQAAALAAAGARPGVAATLMGPGAAGNPVAAPGQPVRVGIAYHNYDGDAPAAGAALTATLPAGLRYVGASPEPQSVSGATLTWALGELPAGAPPELIALDLAVEPGAAVGAKLPVAVQIAAGADADPADNQAAVAVTVRPAAPDLSVASDLEAATLVPGDDAPVGVVITNNGTVAAAAPELTVTLPASVALAASAPAHAGVVGRTFRWQLPALAPGESRAVALTLRPDALIAASGQAAAPLRFELRAGAGAQADAEAADNELVVERPLSAEADLAVSLARRAGSAAGQEADYVLGYVNAGGRPAGATSVTLTLDAGLALVSSSPAAAVTTTPEGRTALRWELGALAPGAGGHIVVRARAGGAGGQVLQAEIAGAAPEAGGANNLAVLGADWSVPTSGTGPRHTVSLPLLRR